MKKSVLAVMALAVFGSAASAQEVKGGQEKTSFEKRKAGRPWMTHIAADSKPPLNYRQ